MNQYIQLSQVRRILRGEFIIALSDSQPGHLFSRWTFKRYTSTYPV